ncbi:hypothetical protein JNUCC64_27285 [Streptomyces sp. JNUCC 64]
MTVESLLRDTLREVADGTAPAPVDLADRVLAARRRARRVRAAVVTAVVAVLAVLSLVGDAMLPWLPMESDPAKAERDSDVIASPNDPVPDSLIAAGSLAVGAYYTVTTRRLPNGDTSVRRSYWLLDRSSDTYVPAPWAYLDVAPGLRTAAVLEGPLPTRRIGLVDLDTGEVTRWIPVREKIAAVAFSPDGTRLVATSYGTDPDTAPPMTGVFPIDRTGFGIIDIATGREKWHETEEPIDFEPAFGRRHILPYPFSRPDYDWTPDGRRVLVPYREGGYLPPVSQRDVTPNGAGTRDLNGNLVDSSERKEEGWSGRFPGLEVLDVPLAWPDEHRVIVWRCQSKDCDQLEGARRLTLVDLRTKRSTPLTGAGQENGEDRWAPVLVPR